LFPATRVLASIAACPAFFAIGSALYNLLANHRYLLGRCKNDHCSLEK
jgi:hypothetical protein